MIAASYYPKTKRGPACVIIEQIEGGRRREIHFEAVNGARAARTVAASFNAQPWNF